MFTKKTPFNKFFDRRFQKNVDSRVGCKTKSGVHHCFHVFFVSLNLKISQLSLRKNWKYELYYVSSHLATEFKRRISITHQALLARLVPIDAALSIPFQFPPRRHGQPLPVPKERTVPSFRRSIESMFGPLLTAAVPRTLRHVTIKQQQTMLHTRRSNQLGRETSACVSFATLPLSLRIFPTMVELYSICLNSTINPD